MNENQVVMLKRQRAIWKKRKAEDKRMLKTVRKKNIMKIREKKSGKFTFYSPFKLTKDVVIEALMKNHSHLFEREMFISKGLVNMTVEAVVDVKHVLERFKREVAAEGETSCRHSLNYRKHRDRWKAEYTALLEHVNNK